MMSVGAALVKTQVSSTVSTSLGSSSDFWRLRISSRTQARNHHRGGRSAGPIRHSVGWHPEGGCEMKGTRAQMRERTKALLVWPVAGFFVVITLGMGLIA